MSINETFAHYSNLFIILALTMYAIAFVAYTAEWAFGTRSRFGRKVAQVGGKQAQGRVVRQAAAPAAESVNAADGGHGVTVLTRSVAEDEEPTISNGNLRADVKVDTTPTISRQEAAQKAIASVGCAECKTEEAPATLFILRHEGKDRLVYRVWPRTPATDAQHPMVFVDAHSGEFVRNCPARELACFDRG